MRCRWSHRNTIISTSWKMEMQQRNSQSSISVAMEPSQEGRIPSDTDGDVFVPIPNPILSLTISPPAVSLYTKSPFLFPFLYGQFIYLLYYYYYHWVFHLHVPSHWTSFKLPFSLGPTVLLFSTFSFHKNATLGLYVIQPFQVICFPMMVGFHFSFFPDLKDPVFLVVRFAGISL